MKRRRILVTGGAGFIGSHTCKMLASYGMEPVVYDNLSTGNIESVKWGPFVQGELLDTDLLASTISRYTPDAVIHFAASAYVDESVVTPAKYYKNNVSGMFSLLDACLMMNLSSIVFSSSCATYGVPDRLPIKEDSPQNPINPYGRTKLIGEMMLRDYAQAYGLRHVILRYFNACGADPDGEIGEWHRPETHLIPRALMAAAGRLDQLAVFGDDYETPDGTCVRDYIHVNDLAHAHLLAVEHLTQGGENIAVNIGTGTGISIREIVDSVARTTERSIPILIGPRRAGDPPALYADPTLARDKLGFTAELSDIDTIVETAAPFFGLGVRRQVGDRQ
ncbi:UDP-glucose 4-epimerase GalE [Mesorhizobium sp. AaZ16]|uniref:UDP-glucose 4-epimerase GalE n=1 Tax=Mesorhizobium sp. AaZ16 TaxID=3402289 RepID=UPI00374E3FEE